MLSPFPGMNPYLENPKVWPQIHKWLTLLIAETMNPQICPKYWVSVEERVYQTTGNNGDDSVLVGIPDNVVVQNHPGATSAPESDLAVAASPPQPVTVILSLPETVKEWYLEVREISTGKVITVIEFLSPKNKQAGEGRKKYQNKRQRILDSLTHLIEIDLLRAGKPMLMDSKGIETHYRILVSRSQARPQADLYAFNIQQEIPSIWLPLQEEDREPPIPLQQLLHLAYERGRYDLVIDYLTKPVPGLSKADAAWVNKVLREQELIIDS